MFGWPTQPGPKEVKLVLVDDLEVTREMCHGIAVFGHSPDVVAYLLALIFDPEEELA